MSKFLGKFRKDQDYSDDYRTMKSMGNKIKKRNEHGEIKKVLSREEQDFDNKVIMANEYYDD